MPDALRPPWMLYDAVVFRMDGELPSEGSSPGAFQHDVMMVLYDPVRGVRPEPNGTSAKAGVA